MELYNLPNVTEQIIKDLIAEHKDKKLPRYKKLMDYYKTKHDILNRTAENAQPNNKLVHDYPGLIVDTIQGYFIGIPVQYAAEKNADRFLDDLQECFESNNEADHNAEMAKYMGIYGEAFELIYVNENSEIRFVRLKNEETIVVLDSELQRSVQLALRYYPILDTNTKKEITRVEMYYADRVEYYTQQGDRYRLEESKPHYFGKVPVIYYNNNDECLGDFEKVVSLIDDYDKKVSDNSNELEAFRNSYLKLVNMSGTEDEDIIAAKKMGAFKVEDGGDIAFITKDINDAYVEHHISRLDADIHKFSKVPNLSDENFAGNLSGVAIKYKLWPIEQITVTKERKFRTGLKRRIKLIAEILAVKGKNYNWRDIKVTFKRNIPANVFESSQIAANLKGIISDETLLSILPFIESADKELEKIGMEQENDQNYNLLDKTYKERRIKAVE